MKSINWMLGGALAFCLVLGQCATAQGNSQGCGNGKGHDKHGNGDDRDDDHGYYYGHEKVNPKGANSILGSKVKLGADASAAVGPKGRAAAADTDIVMKAEVLSYSRSRGLFAGISLEGSTLRSDGSANKKLYGRSLSAKEIVREGKVGVPVSGRKLVSLLDQKSPKNESDPVSLKE
jgi:hypothetical protein